MDEILKSILKNRVLLPKTGDFNELTFKIELKNSLNDLKEKFDSHPELFGTDISVPGKKRKILLDALYEEGIIPTYSFPKNVVSTYISDYNGKLQYSVDRGLDMAISEYAPGRAIVVDKKTYQIGGLYYPGSEKLTGHISSPAKPYIEDPNYLKSVISCPECGWFDLMDQKFDKCPFCGNKKLKLTRKMLRPWGFAPRDGEAKPDVQISEEYSTAQQPLYSTLPAGEEMKLINGCQNIRIASRTNQRIIMVNNGPSGDGFIVCCDCGAAMPGSDPEVLRNVKKPYYSDYHKPCKHSNTKNVNLGYDFITDMLVLEFKIDSHIIDVKRANNLWLHRAGQSLAEALRLIASKKLDVEFTELVTGYRLRTNPNASFVDIYLYDSLSSGAGYAVSVSNSIDELLTEIEGLLGMCTCASACSNCLKNYQNQHIHGQLARFAALQLLEWGKYGKRALPISPDNQIQMLKQFTGILKRSGCELELGDTVMACLNGVRKRIVIYPAMWVEPRHIGTIFISDALIKYAAPYAVQKILESLK